nr:hypothetical protein [Micromonospora sp. DSM 115978]
MKRRSIQNDPITTAERDRGLVVPIRIFMNAVEPAPPAGDLAADADPGAHPRADRG